MDDHECGVGLCALIQKGVAYYGKGLLHLRQAKHEFFDLRRSLTGSGDRGAVRQLNQDEERPLVFLREKARRCSEGEPVGACGKSANKKDRQRSDAQKLPDDGSVAVTDEI